MWRELVDGCPSGLETPPWDNFRLTGKIEEVCCPSGRVFLSFWMETCRNNEEVGRRMKMIRL